MLTFVEVSAVICCYSVSLVSQPSILQVILSNIPRPSSLMFGDAFAAALGEWRESIERTIANFSGVREWPELLALLRLLTGDEAEIEQHCENWRDYLMASVLLFWLHFCSYGFSLSSANHLGYLRRSIGHFGRRSGDCSRIHRGGPNSLLVSDVLVDFVI